MIASHDMALARRRAIGLLMDHTIRVLVEVDAQQEAEEEASAEFVSRATAVLAEGGGELEVDPDTLAGALDAAVARGGLLQQTRYRREDAGALERQPGLEPGSSASAQELYP